MVRLQRISIFLLLILFQQGCVQNVAYKPGNIPDDWVENHSENGRISLATPFPLKPIQLNLEISGIKATESYYGTVLTGFTVGLIVYRSNTKINDQLLDVIGFDYLIVQKKNTMYSELQQKKKKIEIGGLKGFQVDSTFTAFNASRASRVIILADGNYFYQIHINYSKSSKFDTSARDKIISSIKIRDI